VPFVAYRPPHSTAISQVLHRVGEEEVAWTKISTASGEFNPCPEGLTHQESFLPQGGVYRWPDAPLLIHFDQRQRNSCAGNVVNTAAQGQQRFPP
jgi:hypothetical protein